MCEERIVQRAQIPDRYGEKAACEAFSPTRQWPVVPDGRSCKR